MRPPFPKSMFSAFQCLTLWFFNRILMLPIETYLKTKQNIRQKVLMLSFVWVPYHKPSSYTSKSDFFFFFTYTFVPMHLWHEVQVHYLHEKEKSDRCHVCCSKFHNSLKLFREERFSGGRGRALWAWGRPQWNLPKMKKKWVFGGCFCFWQGLTL